MLYATYSTAAMQACNQKFRAPWPIKQLSFFSDY